MYLIGKFVILSLYINYDQYGIVVHVLVVRPTLFTSSLSEDKPQAESMHLNLVSPHNISENGQSASIKFWHAALKPIAQIQVLLLQFPHGYNSCKILR